MPIRLINSWSDCSLEDNDNPVRIILYRSRCLILLDSINFYYIEFILCGSMTSGKMVFLVSSEFRDKGKLPLTLLIVTCDLGDWIQEFCESLPCHKTDPQPSCPSIWINSWEIIIYFHMTRIGIDHTLNVIIIMYMYMYYDSSDNGTRENRDCILNAILMRC